MGNAESLPYHEENYSLYDCDCKKLEYYICLCGNLYDAKDKIHAPTSPLF